MSFSPYDAYRPSAVPWIGKVPEHWRVAALKRRFQVVGGSTPKSDVQEYWDGNIPWATPTDLGGSRIHTLKGTGRLITESGLASCGTTVVPEGSIVLSTRAPIGSLAIAGVPLCTNQGCRALVPTENACARYFAYALSICTTELNVRGRGSTFLELSADELGSFQIPMPPKAEQAFIAIFLDRETAKIDALVAAQERLIHLLKEKRQAAISHAVTKGLNPKAPMKPSGIAWLGGVPAQWQATRLRAIYRLVKRQNQTDKPVLSVYRDYGVIFKDSRDDNINKTPEDLTAYQLVSPGDLAVNKMKAWQGSLGISDVEGITSPDYAVFVPTRLEHSSRFMHYLLRCELMVSAYRGISNGIRLDQWRIEADKFLSLAVFLPDLSEQSAIASALSEQVASLDSLAAESLRATNLLEERRAALISAAVTGRIDVRRIAPTEAA